jgi:hypothetical protein
MAMCVITPATSATASAAPIVIEGESLVPGATVTQGTASAQANCCGVSWSGGKQLFFRATAAGAEAGQASLSHAISLPAGQQLYDVTIVWTVAPDYGIARISFFGHTQEPRLYGYSPQVGLQTVDHGTVYFNGPTTFTLWVYSKEAASTGYYAGIDKIVITPVAGG